jgi:hypothetical protein
MSRTTIRTRVSQCLAAAALMAGVTIGAAAVASAEWDIGEYDQCRSALFGKGLTNGEFLAALYSCCIQSGGDWNGYWSKCQAPPAVREVDPGPTVAPPVLQPVQPSPPVINVAPRGPNSGTLG